MSQENEGQTLYHAFNQWAARPADERFTSLDDLHSAVLAHRAASRTLNDVDLKTMTVDVAPGVDDPAHVEPVIIGPRGGVARLTSWAFGQLAKKLSAPANYLRRLPAQLAAANLQNGLAQLDPDLATGHSLTMSVNGGLTVRSLLTSDYKRIWDSDITGRLLRFVDMYPDWRPAPEAFDGARGLYASEKDMFAFLVNNGTPILEDVHGGLGKFLMIANSEVGDRSFWAMRGRYEMVCGNHRIIGARDTVEIRIPHRGTADEKAWALLGDELIAWSQASDADDVARIRAAQRYILGGDKDAVLDFVFGLSGLSVPRKTLAAAYDLAVEREETYGNPHSIWGFNGGLTEIARDLPNADKRTELDRAAGRIMELVF